MIRTPGVGDRIAQRISLLPLVLFGVFRVFTVWGTSPQFSNDSPGYLALKWVGGERLPTVPLLYTLAGGDPDLILSFQIAIAIFCWIASGLLLSNVFRRPSTRLVFLSLYLYLGTTPQVAFWDGWILSESLSISLGVLAAALGIRAVIDRRTRFGFWYVTALIAWLFCRQSHGYVALIFVFAFILWTILSRDRGRIHVFLVLGTMLPALLAVAAASGNPAVVKMNLQRLICVRVLGKADLEQWWLRAGMPPVPSGASRLDQLPCVRLLESDKPVRQWMETSGWDTYVKFVVGHPAYVASAFTDRGMAVALVAGPSTQNGRNLLPHWLSLVYWPVGSVVLLVVTIWLVIWILTLWRAGLPNPLSDARLMIALILVIASFAHAILVWVGLPPPFQRQMVVADVHLRLAHLFYLVTLWDIGVTTYVNAGVENGNRSDACYGNL